MIRNVDKLLLGIAFIAFLVLMIPVLGIPLFGTGVATDMIFYFLALLCIISAMGVVSLKNIVHSAFLLALTFVSIAGIFIMLGADFVAAAQILLYAGAVTIMMVFAVMLTSNEIKSEAKYSIVYRYTAFIFIGLGLLILLLRNIWNGKWFFSPPSGNVVDTTLTIGKSFFNEYLLPFEVASVILLMALIGAIVLARKEKLQ